MKIKNNEKGITLVALVITIIVLLILAGVTLAALSGQNGILTRGSQSKVATNVSTAKESINLGAQELITEYFDKKYVKESLTEAETSQTCGDYVAAGIATNSQAKSYIASVSGETITTNVKDATGATLTGTIADDGIITWTNDALEST